MARHVYFSVGGFVAEDSPADAVSYFGPVAAPVVWDAFDSKTGGTQIDDLVELDGSTPATQVTTQPNTYPQIIGPDEADYSGLLWLQDVDNPSADRIPMLPDDIAERVGLPSVSAADIDDAGAAGIAAIQAVDAAALQTAAGASALGSDVLEVANLAALLDLLAASTIGKALLAAANAGVVRTQAGFSTVGSNIGTAATQDAAQTALGLSTLGKALGMAASAVAARSAISAPSQTETDLKIKATPGGTGFQFGKGPLANRPAPGTVGLEDGALWLETAP